MFDDRLLESICLQSVEVATRAGQLILDARLHPLNVATKKNSADIVTEVDRAIEEYIEQRLGQAFPTYLFMGEESFQEGQCLTNEPTFVVDPIDGTSNFVHGLPDVCVSIGMAIDRVPVMGVVYNPFHDELWYASRGNGAFYRARDGLVRSLTDMQVQPLEGLRHACVGVEWGSDREGVNFEANLSMFLKLARTAATGGRFVNSIRATGSAAIAMCRVAAGQQDCFWECGCWAWDVCAAWCVVSESGGMVVDVHPGLKQTPLENRRYLAVRPASRGQMDFIEEFWSVVGETRWTYGV